MKIRNFQDTKVSPEPSGRRSRSTGPNPAKIRRFFLPHNHELLIGGQCSALVEGSYPFLARGVKMIDHLPIEIGLPRFAIARGGKARSHLEEEILRNRNLEHMGNLTAVSLRAGSLRDKIYCATYISSARELLETWGEMMHGVKDSQAENG